MLEDALKREQNYFLLSTKRFCWFPIKLSLALRREHASIRNNKRIIQHEKGERWAPWHGKQVELPYSPYFLIAFVIVC